MHLQLELLLAVRPRRHLLARLGGAGVYLRRPGGDQGLELRHRPLPGDGEAAHIMVSATAAQRRLQRVLHQVVRISDVAGRAP